MEKWQIRKQKTDYENRIFRMRNLDCLHKTKNVENDFYVIDTFNWVNIIALTTDGKFILVKQHRLGTDEISVETPGGVIDEGETPEDCAVRELREETGFIGKSVHLLKSLWVNPAIMSNRITFYLIEGCVFSASQDLDEAEDIEVMTVSVDELSGMIRDGILSHSIALNGLCLYFLSQYNRFGQVTF
ncbi:MAG TPA: NUDIX hydrolase [Spirochaetota bacterium]|nr:NUDIX hydrolase [Spirochaetota bacterium]HPS87796.1 NUDIX hydrolase [Spirochaetota bacterium]